MLFEVYKCVQLNRWCVVCGCVLHRVQRGEVWCVCVGMILGWDFYWLGVGKGCDVFLWGGRVRKRRSWGSVDVLGCYGCVAGGVSVLC